MSKKGLKENQIFAARDTVEENDKIKAAREAVAADPTNAEKYMALGLALRGQMFFREALEAYSIGLTYDPFMSLLYRHERHSVHFRPRGRDVSGSLGGRGRHGRGVRPSAAPVHADADVCCAVD